MTIREATLADSETLTNLAQTTMRSAFGPPHNPAELVDQYIQSAITQPVLEQELTDKRAIFFLLTDADEQAVGYAKLRQGKPPRRLQQRPAIEIQRLYLAPSTIGKGWGRQLMQHCLDWAHTTGYRAVWLGVWERNERAIAFYERAGFAPCGYHFFQFGDERQRDNWLYKLL